jgi:hypothetical protein
MKYLKLPILIAATIIIASCGSNPLNITENEDKGVKEILEFYGGYCKYALGMSASTESGNKKYFQLELSQSEFLTDKANAQVPASNIAYLFYKNLNREERANYSEIHSVLVFKDGEKKTFVYPSKDLDLFDQRMQVVHKVVGLIKEKKFEDLKPMLIDTAYFNYDKNELISNLSMVDSQFGNVTEGFSPLGFVVNETKDGTKILHITGAIVRDKQNNQFSVDLDLNGKDDKVYLLEYKQ